MPTPTDRKIMMLLRVNNRLRKRYRKHNDIVTDRNNLITKLQNRVDMLVGRLRGGDGARAPVPDAYMAGYREALEWATTRNYTDGRTLAWFKDANSSGKAHEQLIGSTVVDWKVVRIAEGLYDLENIKEWQYT